MYQSIPDVGLGKVPAAIGRFPST